LHGNTKEVQIPCRGMKSDGTQKRGNWF